MFPLRFAVSASLAGLLLAGCCTSRKTVAALPGGRDLLRSENFYSFIEKQGVNSDVDHVFTWQKNGQLRISGQHYGYLATKETNFTHYKLVVEYKYGEKTWAPREDKARDGGVLVHFIGPDRVWPTSLEAQIIEGGSGDVLVVNGGKLTVDGVTKGPAIARFDRPGRNPWEDVKGFRGPNEIEKPHGQWNTLEILCRGDVFSVSVNGIHTITGTNAYPQAGKILVQSEGAEMYFRRLEMQPLP